MKNETKLEAIKLLKKVDDFISCCGYKCGHAGKYIDQIKALLKDEPDDWIPVSEMPKDKEPCYWVPRNCIDRIEVCVLKYFAKKRVEFERDFSYWQPIVLPKPTCSECGGSEKVPDGVFITRPGNELTVGPGEPCPKGCQPQTELKHTEDCAFQQSFGGSNCDCHVKPMLIAERKSKEPPKRNGGSVPEESESYEIRCKANSREELLSHILAHCPELKLKAEPKPDAGEFVRYLRSISKNSGRLIYSDLDKAAARIEQLETRLAKFIDEAAGIDSPFDVKLLYKCLSELSEQQHKKYIKLQYDNAKQAEQITKLKAE